MNKNKTGYLDNSNTKNNPYNIISSNKITMKGVSQPITAIPIINGKPDYSKRRVLQPGQEDVTFEGAESVMEIPFSQNGNLYNDPLPGVNFNPFPQTNPSVFNTSNNYREVPMDTRDGVPNTPPSVFSGAQGLPQNMFDMLALQGQPGTTADKATTNVSPISPQDEEGYRLREQQQALKGFPLSQTQNNQGTVGVGSLPEINPTGDYAFAGGNSGVYSDAETGETNNKEDSENKLKEHWMNALSSIGGTRDLSSSLTRAGYGFSFNADDMEGASPQQKSTARTGNTIATIGAVGNSLLKGAKDFMYGASAANREQQAANEFARRQDEARRDRGMYYAKKGGQKQDEMVLTGGYTQGVPEGSPVKPNSELEKGEYTQTPDGQVQEVIGRRHSDKEGGEFMDLENGTKVISDYIKIGGDVSKKINKNFKIKTNTSNSFATVLDKYKKQIGLTKLLEDYEKVIGKVKDQEDVEDEATKDVNLTFLNERVQELEQQKQPLDKMISDFTTYLFEEQENKKVKDAEKETYKKGGLKLYQEGGTIAPEEVEQVLQEFSKVADVPYEQLIQEFAELEPKEKEAALQEMVQVLQQAPQQQEEAQTPSPDEFIAAYAEFSGVDPNEIVQEIQQLPQEQQQQALQGMAKEMQGAANQLKEGGEIKKYQKGGQEEEGVLSKGLNWLKNIMFLGNNGEDDPNYEVRLPRNFDEWMMTKPLFVNPKGQQGEWEVEPQAEVTGVGGEWRPNVKPLEGEITPKDAEIGVPAGELKRPKVKGIEGEITPKDVIKQDTKIGVETKQLKPPLTETTKSNPRFPILPMGNMDQSIAYPTGLEFGRLQSVTPINVNPVNVSPQAQINEVNRQVNLGNKISDFRPDSTRASQIANILTTGTEATNKAIAQTNLQNAQLNQKTQQYNENQVGAAEKMNTELAQNYTDQYLRAKAALESQQTGWQQYMNQVEAQNSRNRWNQNAAAAMFPNFEMTADGRLVPKPGHVNSASKTPTVQTSKEGVTIKEYLKEKMFKK